MLKRIFIFVFVAVCAGFGGAAITFFAFADVLESYQEIVIGGLVAAIIAGHFVLKTWNK